MSLCLSDVAYDHGSIRTAVQPDGCPHPTMGARLSERTLWQMRDESAAHGNALPIVIQHAPCPSRKFRCLNDHVGPTPRLCGKISEVTRTLREFD
jgi:hypothetical protein